MLIFVEFEDMRKWGRIEEADHVSSGTSYQSSWGKNGAVKCVPKNILQRFFWIQTKLALTNLQEHKKFTDDRLIQSAIQYLHKIDFIWLIWIYKAKIKTPWISLHYNYMNCTKDKHVARHFLSFQ